MDPISSKLTQSALKNVGPISTPPGGGSSNYGVDQSSFGRLLDNQMDTNQTTNAKLMEYVENMSNESVAPPINAIPAGDVHLAKAGEVDKIASTKGNIFDILKEVNDTQLNMDNVMETLTSGNKKFSTQEMMRLQVLAHVNTVNMEVISKVGEMANKAISTPFNMQIS
jgi:hypothetical protein